MNQNALGSFRGFDTQGRAVIGIRPTSEVALRNNVAHEAAHTLMAPLGMTEEEEHEWADPFALCFNSTRTDTEWVQACSVVRVFFSQFHR